MKLTGKQKSKILQLVSTSYYVAVTNSTDRSMSQEDRDAYKQEANELQELHRAVSDA